jgi:hypothetical protein
MKNKLTWVMLSLTIIVALVFAGCSVPSTGTQSSQPGQPVTSTVSQTGQPAVSTTARSGQVTSTTSIQTGRIEVKVTDAPPKQEVTSIKVTVTGVQIHVAGNADSDNADEDNESNWKTLELSGPTTFDLLKIKGIEQELAIGDLEVGKYTQIRMEVSKVQVALNGGELQDAVIPSGKLKFIQPFDVVAGKATVILFDFDAARSVNIAGNGKIMFKPVIKLSVTKNPGNLEITTPALDNGEVDESYYASLSAMGGTAPYTWSISVGHLPDGLILKASTGVISGKPTTAGSYDFTVKVEDSNTVGKKSTTQKYTIDIAEEGVLRIITTDLPEGVDNATYSTIIEAVGGTDNYTWSIFSDDLPEGLTLDSEMGEISGTPSQKGRFTFTVKVIDDAEPVHSDTQKFTLTIVKEATE